MKKTISIIAFIFTATVAFSQPVIDRASGAFPEHDAYVIDSRMGAYLGTWQWTSGNEVFKITLTKKIKFWVDFGGLDFYTDVLIGWHSYTKNGVVIEDYFNKQKNVDTVTRFVSLLEQVSITGHASDTDMKLLITTKGYDKMQDAHLKFVPGKTDELQWTINNKESIYPAKQEKFSIPVNMVLKKVVPPTWNWGGGLIPSY